MAKKPEEEGFSLNRMKRGLCLALCLTLCLGFFGCGSASKEDPAEIFDVVLWGPYIDEDSVRPKIEAMLAEIPELKGQTVRVTTVSTGDPDKLDATVYAANAMRLTAMASCGEVDVAIMSTDSAQRAARGDLFMPLSEFFTESELDTYDGRLLDYTQEDVTGQDEGTRTPICGIDVSGSSYWSSLLPQDGYGVYAVTDIGPEGMTKAVIQYLAGL